jgi:hypothetical protein
MTKPPSRAQAKGYDLVVWIDDDGDIVTRGFTERGLNFLKTILPQVRFEDIVMITAGPDEFAQAVGEYLKVGYKNPESGLIAPMRDRFLH